MKATPLFATCIFLFLFLSWNPISAQTHKPMEIVELAANATAVVRGEVKEIKGSSLILKVDYCMIGDVGGELEVKRFKNTKVAKRWGKYEAGQKLLLFLTDENGKLAIMGINGEGEKFVMGDDVYLDGRGGGVLNRYSYTDVPGGRIYAEKVALDEFEEAITGLRKAYSVSYDAVTNNANETTLFPRAKVICEETELEEFRTSTNVAMKLVEKSNKLVK